jgi:hypothetical protein
MPFTAGLFGLHPLPLLFPLAHRGVNLLVVPVTFYS